MTTDELHEAAGCTVYVPKISRAERQARDARARKMHDSGMSARDIARKLGLSLRQVQRIVYRRR